MWLRNFTQKDLTEVKIFQKVLRGYSFETPCIVWLIWAMVNGGSNDTSKTAKITWFFLVLYGL